VALERSPGFGTSTNDNHDTVISGGAGRFSMENLQPGEYKLIAWDDQEGVIVQLQVVPAELAR
jgi:hypothetical protein